MFDKQMFDIVCLKKWQKQMINYQNNRQLIVF